MLHKLWSKPITTETLRYYFEDPLIKTAIYIASQTVYAALEKWYVDNPTKQELALTRLENTFLKYLIRSASRPTPFGMFAGVSLGSFSCESKVSVQPIEAFSYNVRLDMNYLSELISYLEKHPAVIKQLQLRPNSSLFGVANQYRYIKQQLINAEKTYSVEAVEATPYIDTIITSSKTGKTIAALAQELIADDISNTEAEQFVKQLFQMQLLVSDLEPSITGSDPFQQITASLASNSESNLQGRLEKISTLLQEIEQQPVSTHISRYKKIMDEIDQLGASYNPKYLFQLDLSLATEHNTLDYSVKKEVLEVLPILNALTPYRSNKNLESFITKFRNRFEEEEVPLLHALDVETGIPYPPHINGSNTTPFLNDLAEIQANQGILPPLESTSALDSRIMSELIGCIANGNYTLNIENLELDQEKIRWDDLPDTFSGIVEINHIENQRVIALESFGGSSGANLIARFCENDGPLRAHAQSIIATEEAINADKILAEIVHLPEARVGNILKHPPFRTYEIPYLAQVHPDKKAIPLDDVVISLHQNELVLRSKSLKSVLLPRLTNAHNFTSNSLPVYQLLCDLQLQNKRSGLAFSWPKQARDFPFLPRVFFKNCVLSRARWKISKQEILSLEQDATDQNILLSKVTAWRKEKNMPDKLVIKDFDNKLLIYFNNISMVRLFFEIAKKKKTVILEEFLSDTTVAKQGNSQYANEFVMTLYNTQKQKATAND